MSTIPWDQLKQRDAAERKGLPADSYVVILVHAQAGESQNGNPKMDLRFKVDEGPYAGSTIFHTMTLAAQSGFALVNFFDSMAAMGLPQERFVGSYTLEQAAAELMSSTPRVRVKTKIDTSWGDRPRTKIDGVLMSLNGAAPSGLPASPVTSSAPALPPMPEPVQEAPSAPVSSPFMVAPRVDGATGSDVSLPLPDATPATEDSVPF